MTNENDLDLGERLSLIETMIAEGRRSTQSWGWSFLLWGVALYVATAWASVGRSAWAWPVTMVAAGILTPAIGRRTNRGRPSTVIGRAIGSIWGGIGAALFIVLFSLELTGHYEPHVFVAVIGGMLGAANLTSGLILRWKMQYGCALIWWATAIAACIVPADQAAYLFLAAIFPCQILFGIYAMMCESRKRRLQGAVHA